MKRSWAGWDCGQCSNQFVGEYLNRIRGKKKKKKKEQGFRQPTYDTVQYGYTILLQDRRGKRDDHQGEGFMHPADEAFKVPKHSKIW